MIIVELLLAASLFALVLLLSMTRKDYLAESAFTFVNTFLPEGFEPQEDSPEGSNTAYLSSIEQTVDTIQSVVRRYHDLPQTNPDTYAFSGGGPSIVMTTRLFDINLRDYLVNHNSGGSGGGDGNSSSSSGGDNKNPLVSPMSIIPSHYLFTPFGSLKKYEEYLTLENPLGDLFSREGSDLRAVFDSLHSVWMQMRLVSLDTSGLISPRPDCHMWVIDFELDNSKRSGNMPLRISYSSEDCRRDSAVSM